MSTICTVLFCMIGCILIFVTCRPFNALRTALMVTIVVGIVGAIALLGRTFFGMTALSLQGWLILGIFMLLSFSAFYAITKAVEYTNSLWHRIRHRLGRE